MIEKQDIASPAALRSFITKRLWENGEDKKQNLEL
jgi:hypothetical protein